MLMHFTDLALVNSWHLNFRDNYENRTPSKAIMKFLEIRMIVAEVFLKKSDVRHEDVHIAEAENEKMRQKWTPSTSSQKTSGHSNPHDLCLLQSFSSPKDGCAKKKPCVAECQVCSGKSRVPCMTCDANLCLQSERNCLDEFYHGL